jgi:IclR family acetate operon transcriptional repressor
MHLVDEMGESVVTVRTRVGELVPYHTTAVGKALLAFLPRQTDLVLSRPLERYTDYSIVHPADLVAELARIRERGYAVDDRENSLDLRCVAAPVFDFSGEAVGALGVSAPAGRLRSEALSMAASVVVEVAQAFSEGLGFGAKRAHNGAGH